MSTAKGIVFRKLQPADATALSKLLLSEPPDYRKYFHPFDFAVSSLTEVLCKATRDQFIGIEIIEEGRKELAGFYMLRGLDEGFVDPMYGVFIAGKYAGQGLAGSSLRHAEEFCKTNGKDRLLLKVHPENNRAKSLYEKKGFTFIRIDPGNKNLLLGKQLKPSK